MISCKFSSTILSSFRYDSTVAIAGIGIALLKYHSYLKLTIILLLASIAYDVGLYLLTKYEDYMAIDLSVKRAILVMMVSTNVFKGLSIISLIILSYNSDSKLTVEEENLLDKLEEE